MIARLLVLLLLAPPVAAEGFAQRDLSRLDVDAAAFAGGGLDLVRAEPARLTLACVDCEGTPMIDVLVGRQDDGTEGRVRSGETTAAELEALCRRGEPGCRLDLLDVAPAVGWITAWSLGGLAVSTAVVIRDGDLLTIRSVAATPGLARANADAALATLAPQVVGG